MKKNKLLVMLACLGLLVTGCNPGGNTNSDSTSGTKPSTSSNPPSTQTTPSTSQPSTTSSEPTPQPADDDYYYSLPFEAAAKDSGDKWKKGYESVWTFKVSKNHAKMEFAFAAQMSSSSHGDRSLYTNHEGASSNDSFESNEANDGTCRIELKVNGVAQTVTTKTYEEAGLTNSEMNYFRVASFAVTAGEVVVSMKTHAQTGYRLMFGDDARLFYPKADGQDPAYVEPQPVDAYKVTFVSSHCKLYAYNDEDYTVNPTEVTGPVYTRDSNGNLTKYVAPDADGNGEVKPQVNFKVVCDNGYEVDTNCIAISGTEHTEWNHLDDIKEGIFSVTTIKADLTITITPVTTGTLKAGYVATFVTEHCSIKVYTNKKFDVEDTATPYMSRTKTKADDGTFPYAKGEDAQLSFEVVPEEGYEFVSGIEVGAETKAKDVNWIAPEGYNKVKRNAENQYNLTKVSRDLTITVKCTEAVVVPPTPVEGTKVTKTVAELATENSWENETAVNSLTIGQVDVTLTGDNGDTKYYSSNNTLRLYVLKNGGSGSVAFAAKQGYKIVSVKLTFTWNKNVGTVETLKSGQTVEINAASASYAIANNDASNNEQMRITAFEIVYDAIAA